MPNRMLRPWTMSFKIKELTVYAERFFTRLIMVVDDYGRFYAEPSVLKANLFPLLLDSIRDADLLRWMEECRKAGLIVIYEAKGKSYLQIEDFRQRLRQMNEKFPPPVNCQSSVSQTHDLKRREVEEKSSEDAPLDLSNSNLYRQPNIPTRQEVEEAFVHQGGTSEMAAKFFETNEVTGWYYKSSPITNFRRLIPGYIAEWKRRETGSPKNDFSWMVGGR